MRIKRLVNPARGQQGMASIVVVSVLIIIMTLISIGFARLVSRVATNSADRQFSNSASYAAQSAINDVAAYLKKYANDPANAGSNLLPRSTKCNGAGSLIGSAPPGIPGPFFNDSNLSGDSGRSSQYTCLLLDPTPNSLVYRQVDSLKSQVVKVNTSAVTGALDKLMISWQPSDPTITGYPASANSLLDETTWNSSTSNCKDTGADASCVPMLRLSVFPISNGEALSSAQAQSKTVFLYPQKPNGTVPIKPFTDANFKDGSLIAIPCTQTVGAGDFNPSGQSGYKCNIIINALSTAIAPANTDSVYLRLTPIYNKADIKISANDKFGDALNFIGDQAIIDATAQTGGVAKRLQARVDTSSLVSTANSVDTNISSNSNSIPEQSLRSANALCKREVVTTPSLPGFPAFVNFDDPDTVCHDLGSTTTITNPVPTLAFSIIGGDGSDIGKRVCSTGDAPETNLWGCTDAKNPDSPQNPVQQGTVYINSSSTLNWSSTQATSCTATGGWSGEKLASVSGPNKVGSGSQPIAGITNITEYDLICSRPGAPADTPTKKVFAWPHPTVSFNQTTVTAGQPFSLSWNVANSTSCNASNAWSGSKSASAAPATFSESQGVWPFNDNSTKTFVITCQDPIGRSAPAQITLGPGQADNCAPSISCSGNVNPPPCHASVSVVPDGTGSGNYQWNGYCDGVPIGSTYFMLSTEADYNSGDSGKGCWSPNSGFQNNDSAYSCADGGSHLDSITGPGTYSAGFRVGVDPWGWQTGAFAKVTIAPPLTITSYYANIWNQAPECGPATGLFNKTWFCRNSPIDGSGKGKTVTTVNTNSPPCTDGTHRWTTCTGGVGWDANGGIGTVNCSIVASGIPTAFDSSSWNGSGIHGPHQDGNREGWLNTGDPRPLTLTCVDSVGNVDSRLFFPGLF